MSEVRFQELAVTASGEGREIRDAMDRVLASGWFVLGPELEAFEAEFARALECENAVAVASGTDALSLSLCALGVGPGDEVVTSPLTAAFTALAVSRLGARPVFADVEPETLTLSAESARERITARTRAIVPVHLYGNACDMEAILNVANERAIPVVEDACQAHGARLGGRMLGTLGRAGAFSFYPTKNLGALGDGGMIVTGDGEIAVRLRRLRNGGQSRRYVHEELGFNSRLDEIQAAVLRVKLRHLESGNLRRREIAALYERALRDTPVSAVPVRRGCLSARHLFVVRAPSRDELMEHLRSRGIHTLVHYPIPTHLQPAFREQRSEEGSCPQAEKAAREVLSLPLHPALPDSDAERVSEAIREFYRP